MTPAEVVFQKIQNWPESQQSEVLGFVEYLQHRNVSVCEDEHGWSQFSLAAAFYGLDDSEEEEYTLADIKEFY